MATKPLRKNKRDVLEKGHFLAHLSHELRTPLNAIVGFSEILSNPELMPEDRAKQLEYAQILKGAAGHLLSVVDVALDFSRLEAGKTVLTPERVDMAALIREICEMLKLDATQRQVDLLLHLPDTGLEVVADKRACRQILINLISNALKFTSPAGRVLIEARAQQSGVCIAITDTGIGIPPEHLAKLGVPFYQVHTGYDRAFDGLGLGLSLVRGFVGLHRGTLLLESGYGVGTRVSVTLPASVSEPFGTEPALLRTVPHLNLGDCCA